MENNTIQVSKAEVSALLATVPADLRNETLNKYGVSADRAGLRPACGAGFYESVANAALQTDPKMPFYSAGKQCGVRFFADKLTETGSRGTVRSFAERWIAAEKALKMITPAEKKRIA